MHHGSSYQLYRMTVPVAFNSEMLETSQLCEQSIHALTNVHICVERDKGNGMAQYVHIQLKNVYVGQ